MNNRRSFLAYAAALFVVKPVVKPIIKREFLTYSNYPFDPSHDYRIPFKVVPGGRFVQFGDGEMGRGSGPVHIYRTEQS